METKKDFSQNLWMMSSLLNGYKAMSLIMRPYGSDKNLKEAWKNSGEPDCDIEDLRSIYAELVNNGVNFGELNLKKWNAFLEEFQPTDEVFGLINTLTEDEKWGAFMFGLVLTGKDRMSWKEFRAESKRIDRENTPKFHTLLPKEENERSIRDHSVLFTELQIISFDMQTEEIFLTDVQKDCLERFVKFFQGCIDRVMQEKRTLAERFLETQVGLTDEQINRVEEVTNKGKYMFPERIARPIPADKMDMYHLWRVIEDGSLLVEIYGLGLYLLKSEPLFDARGRFLDMVGE